MKRYDIAILGAGPGGYIAALYAASQGKSVAIIERDRLGGVCLNWGCIPTKALIASSNVYNTIKRAGEFGISAPGAAIDFKKIKERKDGIVDKLIKGIESLLKAKKVDLIRGTGKLAGRQSIAVGSERIDADNIIIATGTRPLELPGFQFDKKRVLSSADMLDITELPQKLLIIGGGVNGCEYAYTYASLGVDVTVAEMMDRLLPTMDRELGKNMEMLLKKRGVKIMLKTALDNPPAEYDMVAVCVGRKFNTEGIGLEEAGVNTDKGQILVDKRLRTSVPGIYAIGDAVGGYMLAHIASHEGIVACDNILGRDTEIDYGSVPMCIYTEPQIASVGLTDVEAKKKGHSVKTSKASFRSLGKAHAMGEIEGFVKLVADSKSGTLLGAHIVGAEATTLIAEAAVFVKRRLKVDDIIEQIHAHPTLSEAFMEAAFSIKGRPIHSI